MSDIVIKEPKETIELLKAYCRYKFENFPDRVDGYYFDEYGRIVICITELTSSTMANCRVSHLDLLGFTFSYGGGVIGAGNDNTPSNNGIPEYTPKPAPQFSLNEVRHLAVNYAITCEKGYDGTFDDWFSSLSPSWREIAIRKQ